MAPQINLIPLTLNPELHPPHRQPPPSSAPTASASSPPSSVITLQVCNQTFRTTISTLTSQSKFFDSQLDSNWNDEQPDGAYFLDSDPIVFSHILRYLRSGILPVFYSKDKGHDYELYAAVLVQAKCFKIKKLEAWIEGKRYLDAVKVERQVRVLDSAGVGDGTIGAETEVKCFPQWAKEKVFVCPRRIDAHRGTPGACGRQCDNAQGDKPDKYEDEEILRMLEVRETVIFDLKVCSGKEGERSDGLL